MLRINRLSLLRSSIKLPIIPLLRKTPILVSFAPFSSNSGQVLPGIELQFIGAKADDDGSYPIDTAKAVSGEKLLRDIMLDNNIDLYATYRKLTNCRGRGLCGTCAVEILEGTDLLSERTKPELRHLKKKPGSWRLACQTLVGNKENFGKVVIQRMPQLKK